MPKSLKYSLIAAGAVVALLMVGVAIIAATFNPNDYKPLIIKLVKEKKQRTLTIPGEIKLTFFPSVGADLGKVTISEHKSSAVFASVERVKVSLALMPIFAKQFVVERVVIDGLVANIRVAKDGSANFDDLTSKAPGSDAQPAQQARLDIASVAITNANVSYIDDAAKRKLKIANLNLSTGPLGNGKKSNIDFSADVSGDNPKLALKVKLKSDLRLDLDQQHYVLNKFNAAVSGAAVDFTNLNLTIAGNADLKPAAKQASISDIVVNGDAKRGAQSMHIKFSAPAFEGTPKSIKMAALSLEATLKQGALDATAKLTGALDGDLETPQFRSSKLSLDIQGKDGDLAIKGNISSALNANMKSQLIELAGLSADAVLPNPGGGALAFNAKGSASINLAKEAVQLALTGKLDGSALDIKAGVNDFAKPAYNFDVSIDNLDLDRYTAKGSSPATAATNANAPEKPLDLSALKTLIARGKLQAGALKVANLRATNVKLELLAGGGKVDISPIAANLYGGSVAGNLSVAATNPPRIAMQQTLRNVNIGALLKDAIGKDPIEGQGNVMLNVTASGATVTQMKKGLNGTATLDLKNGAVKGINLAATVRNAKSILGMAQGGTQSNAGAQQGTGSAQEKTDFSELAGSFKIVNGVARNDDLSAKSPLLRLSGNGDIDIGESRIDYTAKATVVSSLQGQGGPEMQAMQGLTVPVKLSGPFNAIGWKVDVASMVGDVAKQKFYLQKDKLMDQLKDKLNEQMKGLFGK